MVFKHNHVCVLEVAALGLTLSQVRYVGIIPKEEENEEAYMSAVNRSG